MLLTSMTRIRDFDFLMVIHKDKFFCSQAGSHLLDVYLIIVIDQNILYYLRLSTFLLYDSIHSITESLSCIHENILIFGQQ